MIHELNIEKEKKKDMKNMSTWYPLEGYPYADAQANVRIEKMRDQIRKINNQDGMSEEAKTNAIRTIRDEITALSFEYDIRFDCVISHIDWLYECGDESGALSLAEKLFRHLNSMHKPNKRALQYACDRLEELLYEVDGDEELADEVILARARHEI